MPRSRVTIRDVARYAGVSHQTVSRVINGSERVNPETRARVEAAIAELAYTPNVIARYMARGRTATLACIAPNLTDYTFSSIIDAAATAVRQHGFFLLSASAPDEATFQGLIEELVTGRRAEGLLVINPFADGRYQLLPPDFPTVFAGARPREEAANSVALNDVAAARMATQHLLDLGHTCIGLITGPMAEDCAQDRRLGYEEALHAAGLAVDPQLIIEGTWQPASGYEAFMTLQQRAVLPTAVFAQNDQMALGVLRAARDCGRHVPSQLSIIGVDDIPLALHFAPPLTTLRQDFARIGREAANLLVQVVEQPDRTKEHLQIESQLIVRRSTAPIG